MIFNHLFCPNTQVVKMATLAVASFAAPDTIFHAHQSKTCSLSLSHFCYLVRFSARSMFITYAMNRIFLSEPVVQPSAIQNWSEHDWRWEFRSWIYACGNLDERVSLLFDNDLSIYALTTSMNSTIQVRIEKFSSKYGSPSMTDIEDFCSAYRALLGEAEQLGTIPDNVSLEVSSPGVERIFRIPGAGAIQ